MAFVVTAIWKAKSGTEQKVLDVIKTMTPLSRAEPKNLYYQAQVSPDDPTKFFLYEQYVDAQGYEEHKASDHFQRHVFGYVLEYLESRQVVTYETIDV